MFKTKRQQRERRLRRLTDRQWATLPAFLILNHDMFATDHDEYGGSIPLNEETLPSRSADPSFRAFAIDACLDEAEHQHWFATKIDRFLGLRTDDDDREYHDYWATKRNKAYYLFAILAFCLSIASLVVSVWL